MPSLGCKALPCVQPLSRPSQLGGTLAPRRQSLSQQQDKDTKCAAMPQPIFEVAADISYYLQLLSFAVLGGSVIYFTLNYIGLNVTLNKAEKAKQKKAEEEAAKQKKGGGFFGLGKK
ncbi:hypothetical protein WJX74_000146 [Apatococcus lobatus]|uniref:Signal sequence receptor subunit gamma n=1 Tax=Apatococcus lobatus TaxID=904363 RepID=A0AAW1RRK5_9CHLO